MECQASETMQTTRCHHLRSDVVLRPFEQTAQATSSNTGRYKKVSICLGLSIGLLSASILYFCSFPRCPYTMWELRSGVLVSVASNCTGVHGVSGQNSQRVRRQAILMTIMTDQRQFESV